MTRVAHLSDMHLNGSAERHGRFAQALGQAATSGATHLLLTGDLTANGRPEQYVELAAALRGWPETAVTAVPGNHDGGPETWCCALAGPLRALMSTSGLGAVTDLGDAVVVPVNTQIPKPAPLWAGRGHVNIGQLVHLDRVARAATGRCVVVAAHHGPQEDPLQMLLGLTNMSDVELVLDRNPEISWCCGHDHRVLDRRRVFAAASVATHDDPLRLYDVAGPYLVPIYRSNDIGSYL
jgi:3',5'-cyclic AMP phosphodiesterase CpdA